MSLLRSAFRSKRTLRTSQPGLCEPTADDKCYLTDRIPTVNRTISIHYLGIEVDNALEISESIEVQGCQGCNSNTA